MLKLPVGYPVRIYGVAPFYAMPVESVLGDATAIIADWPAKVMQLDSTSTSTSNNTNTNSSISSTSIQQRQWDRRQ